MPTAVAGSRQARGALKAPAIAPSATARWNHTYRPALLWSLVPSTPPPAETAGNEISCSTIATHDTASPAVNQASGSSCSLRDRASRTTSAKPALMGAAATNTTARPRGGSTCANNATA